MSGVPGTGTGQPSKSPTAPDETPSEGTVIDLSQVQLDEVASPQAGRSLDSRKRTYEVSVLDQQAAEKITLRRFTIVSRHELTSAELGETIDSHLSKSDINGGVYTLEFWPAQAGTVRVIVIGTEVGKRSFLRRLTASTDR